MEILEKTENRLVLKTNIGISLANALRRAVSEIPTIAIDEVDIYKNDCALYDEIIAHRLGLVPLVNQKIKDDAVLELRLKVKGKDGGSEVLAGEMGDLVVYPEMIITLLEKDQELELVARAKKGTGKIHAKHLPGMVYYKILNEIKISKEGEKHQELAELYPKTFEFNGKLKVKHAWADDLDQEDVTDFKGIEIKPTKDVVIIIETWKQMSCQEIVKESIEVLVRDLEELAKAIK